MTSISALSNVGMRARRCVAGRLLPFGFLIDLVNYIDRVNVSYANLRMSAELGFSDTAYDAGIRRLEYRELPHRRSGGGSRCGRSTAQAVLLDE